MSSVEPSPTRAPAQTSWRALASHRQWLAAETDRLIEFGRGARVDGGFGWLDAAGAPDPAKPLQLWITTRMTHVFALGHLLGIPGCGLLADHGLHAIRETFEDREYGGWFSEVGASRKEAYSHCSSCSPPPARRSPDAPEVARCSTEAIEVVERRFWSEEEGACVESWDRAWLEPEAYRGANANMHMVEAFLAAGDATGDPVWAARALRIAERLVRDLAALARHGAFRCRVDTAAGLQPLRGSPPVPALRRNARPRPRVVALLLQTRRAELAARRRGGAVRTRGRGRLGRRPRVRLHDRLRRATGRHGPVALGARGRRSAPPRRCMPSPAPRRTTAGTRPSGTSRTRGSAIASTEAGGTSSTSTSGRATAHGRESRTSTTRSRRRCFRGSR